MYIEVENGAVVLRMYDDGTYTVQPKKAAKKEFYNDLAALKSGKITPEEFEAKYGIDTLKKKAIKQYEDLLPEIEKAVKDFEEFINVMENML